MTMLKLKSKPVWVLWALAFLPHQCADHDCLSRAPFSLANMLLLEAEPGFGCSQQVFWRAAAPGLSSTAVVTMTNFLSPSESTSSLEKHS